MDRGPGRRLLLIGILILVLLFLPLGARSIPLAIACDASGWTIVSPNQSVYGGKWAWGVSGSGWCRGPTGMIYELWFHGSVGLGDGSSSAGLCGNGELLVKNLSIEVSVNLSPYPFEVWTAYLERWYGWGGGAVRGHVVPSLTTYPVATPFELVEYNGEDIGGTQFYGHGAGSLFTRLGLKCSPAGQETARFVWTQALIP